MLIKEYLPEPLDFYSGISVEEVLNFLNTCELDTSNHTLYIETDDEDLHVYYLREETIEEKEKRLSKEKVRTKADELVGRFIKIPSDKMKAWYKFLETYEFEE